MSAGRFHDLIAANRFHEVGFGEVEADPTGQMGKLHEALGLPAFRQVEPALQRYLASI